VKEEDIRPKELMAVYLRLAEADARRISDAELSHVRCPGCDGSDHKFKFEKYSFSYVECSTCASLFCTPRPSEDALKRYYQTGSSTNYFSEVLWESTKQNRTTKIYRENAKRVFEICEAQGLSPETICDVGSGQGLFLDELRSVFKAARLAAIEPNLSSASKCQEKGYEVMPAIAEEAQEWEGRFEVVISTEVIEHSFSLRKYVKALYRLTKPGGICLVTGIGAEGFDIISLGSNSQNIYPPAHINFLSLKGAQALFDGVGFKEVKIWTPGRLDLDIVLNSGIQNDFAHKLSARGECARSEFQEFLRKHKLSSHLWILGKKQKAKELK